MALTTQDQSFLVPAPPTCDEISHSSLYTMIPSVVRSRIPVLTSLRHSARAVVLHGARGRRKAYTFTCVEATKEQDSYGFTSTASSSRASTPFIRPESPEGSITPQEFSLTTLPSGETKSGVDWDVAATGVRLWMNARSQSHQGGDPLALRSMHIDALRYMHMALPQDLTSLEIESLRASMSPQLILQSERINEATSPRQPSLLRQSVAQMVCWLVAALFLILPVAMTFLNRLLSFEREHQITEKVIANSLDLTTALGERGIRLQKALVRFKDGRLGGACVDAGLWFIEGVIGGVNDGIDAVAQSRRRAV